MMKSFLIRTILLLSVTRSCKASPYTCDKNSVPCGCGQASVGINARIVNGENSVPFSWPMIVSLRDSLEPSRHICGGTILTQSYILTAAHCVNSVMSGETIKNMNIVAGVYKLSQPVQITRQVDNIIIHPLWSTMHSEIQYDIAILHLTEPLDLQPNSSLSRTCLPPRQNTSEEIINYPSNGTTLVVIGWGSLRLQGISPDILQQVTIKSISQFDKVCTNTIRDPSIHFCAGLYEGGKGPCHGDSGGPVFQWIGDRWEQVGIVSYAEGGCAAQGYSTVFTRIAYFHDWIHSHILYNNQTTTSNNETAHSRTLYECSPYGDCSCSRRNVVLSPSKIVESENALPYTWTMIVSIRMASTNEHLCSGTILDNSFILTAAHCLTNRLARDLIIEAGMYYLSESNVLVRSVDRFYIHPNYTAHANQYINDIAIIHLALPLEAYEDKNITRTCLPPFDQSWMETAQRPNNGTPLVIAGWNITNRINSHGPRVLQQAEVFAIDDGLAGCSILDSHSQFCVSRFENDSNICYGGTAGDPVFRWIRKQWTQVGIASYCSVSGRASVFTSLANYSSWIQSMLISTIAQVSRTYQCDKKATCGCGENDVNITVSGVINSDDAIERSWPMIVSVQFLDVHMCVGSILSESFILTSVSCAEYFTDDSSIRIIAGIHNLSDTAAIRRNVYKIYSHPNYTDYRNHLHDIAIIHLGQPIPLNTSSWKYSRTCIPLQRHIYPEPNSSLAVIGWNGLMAKDGGSNILQQMSVRSLSSSDTSCPHDIDNNYQFCVKPANNEKFIKISSLCNEGIGGPVLMYTNSHWEQVGIVSDPYNCFDSGPGRARVYTRLAPYLEWIRNVTNSSFVTYNSSQTSEVENVTSSTFTTSTFTTSTYTTSTKPNSGGVSNPAQNSLIGLILLNFLSILL